MRKVSLTPDKQGSDISKTVTTHKMQKMRTRERGKCENADDWFIVTGLGDPQHWQHRKLSLGRVRLVPVPGAIVQRGVLAKCRGSEKLTFWRFFGVF